MKKEDSVSKERIHEVNELNRHLESRMLSILQEDLKLCALCDFAVNISLFLYPSKTNL